MVSKELLKQIIIENKEFILHKIERIIPRQVYFPKVKKVVVMYGVRRSGKTYLLYDIFRKNKERSLYIDFEDERLIDFEVGDFESLKEVFFELNPSVEEPVFLFDEIQNIKGWEKFVRRICEKEQIDTFVTGSSSKMMPEEIHTALRGRAWSLEVTPFSFREFLKIKNINTEDKEIFYSRKRILIKRYFQEYLLWGGFPEVILADSEEEKRKIVKEYFKAMFFKDLVERFSLTNTGLLSILMENLFSSFSIKVSLTSFYKQFKKKLSFSKDKLFFYYKCLLDSMLLFEVRKFSPSFYKRLRNPAKIYVVDTSLCRRVTLQDYGRLLENIVFLELRKMADEIFYFEEKRECDFVVKDFKGKFKAYQVVWELHRENREREIEGLVNALDYFSLQEGVILTKDQEEEIEIKKKKIKIIPVWKWICSKEDKDYI